MARRKKSSLIDDLFEISAALPWWVGLGLAVISYVILHRYANADVQADAVPGQLGQMVVGQVIKTVASVGQYIFPLAFIAGAMASFLGRRKCEELVRMVGSENSGSVLRGLSWQDFELFVGEAFRMKGYSVVENGGGGADGGVDLILRKGGETFFVQCKQWRALKVSVNIVRELFGVMSAQGATGGIVVTSGVFTEDAQIFAKGRNIELIDGLELTRMIEKVKMARSPRPGEETPESRPFVHKPSAQPVVPFCPKCGASMVKRIAKQGASAGGYFWGCSAFPKCRGIRNFD